MGLLYPGALVFFALVPALVLAYLARERPSRVTVSSVLAFRALRGFRRERFGGWPRLDWMFFAEVLILSLVVLAMASPFIWKTKFSARRRDRQFRRDAGADALGQEPFRYRARKAGRRIVGRKWRRRNFRLRHRAAAATGRAAVHHADRSAVGAAANQADRRAQRSNDAGELSQQSRVGSARREGDFRRRQRARGAGPRADSSDCGRRRGRERARSVRSR